MAQRLFRTAGGFTDGAISYLSGAGAPGGDAGVQDAAGVGSKYGDTAAGDEYIKITAGAGTDKWRRQASYAEVSDLVNNLSWREPAAVYTADDVATVQTDIDADDQIQGVTVQVGDRLLIAGGGNPNVYIVGGSTGAWTLTEDTNQETAGDALKILYGNEAGKEYWYDGTAWVWFGEATSAEEGFLRAFIGKGAAGNEMPSYTSVQYVANGDSLEIAIGKLDAQVATNATDITNLQTNNTNLQTEVDAIETALGLNSDGTWSAHSGTNYLDSATTAKQARELLDSALAAVQTELDTTQASVGLNTDGTMPAFSGTNVLDGSTNHHDALLAIDAQLTSIGSDVTEVVVTNITTITTVDSFLVDDYSTGKWMVNVFEEANPAKKEGFEVFALHDGTAAADATDADYTVYSILRLGIPIQGLDVSVDVSGTGATQEMRLRVESTNAVTVNVSRMVVA